MRCTTQSSEVLPASLDMLILRTLSLRDLRGYGIVQLIQQSSGNQFLVEEGSLYPALQRLELNGWIEGAWGVTSNRRARVYRITTAGRKQLDTPTFDTDHLYVENALVADLRAVKSRLLFGCVVTGVAFGGQPANNLPSGRIPVNVCMEPAQEPLISTTRAKSLVSVIFSQIGVNLTWLTELSDCDQSVPTAFKICWAEHAPSTSRAGALATARPFGSSGTAITIYKVPLQRFLSQHANAPEVVLAYVLAHELAHVMQGLDHHSDSGILKASWSYGEYYRMLSRTLTFTATDVDLIRAGLGGKRSTVTSREGSPQNQRKAPGEPDLASVRLGLQEQRPAGLP